MSAPQYPETLFSLLSPGNQTSEKSLCQTVEMGERVWQRTERHQRDDILMRLDAGFGSDQNINWLLHRGYQVLSNGKSGKRAVALARQVEKWQQVNEGKWIAPVPSPLCHHD